jgi:hypothetical protein
MIVIGSHMGRNPYELEEEAFLRPVLFVSVDEGKAAPLEPPNVDSVAGIYDVGENVILRVQPFAEYSGMSKEGTAIYFDTDRPDHPDNAKGVPRVCGYDSGKANWLTRGSEECHGRDRATNGLGHNEGGVLCAGSGVDFIPICVSKVVQNIRHVGILRGSH